MSLSVVDPARLGGVGVRNSTRNIEDITAVLFNFSADLGHSKDFRYLVL